MSVQGPVKEQQLDGMSHRGAHFVSRNRPTGLPWPLLCCDGRAAMTQLCILGRGGGRKGLGPGRLGCHWSWRGYG